MKGNENVVANSAHLTLITDNLLKRIFAAIDQCPRHRVAVFQLTYHREIRELCALIKNEVQLKFQDHWLKAVGGFLFLRFFCPACVAPDGYGILPGEIQEVIVIQQLFPEAPSEESRRALVLVTKTLQSLANGVTFRGKEDFMASMNPFIERNMEACNKYFEQISVSQ